LIIIGFIVGLIISFANNKDDKKGIAKDNKKEQFIDRKIRDK
jgi:hypothetical protein